MKLPQETINKLQKDPQSIRNICILAHVDHGKTSLSDSLLATNGIISQRMAGKARFLDSREDEQLRGITMESSAISLYFKTMKKITNEDGSDDSVIREHLINLIDSPGHIDFSSEVSTASRLCDGAVVLVDVVEGVCSQTVNVLRQCWVDKLKPILVLNKIDRLILEWKLSPLEAYHHLSRIIEQVNSVIGTFFSGDRMQDDLDWREGGQVEEFVERDDSDLYFSPELNNVIFASAYDGWAFLINTMSRFVSSKLGFSNQVIQKTLWGDFYLDMKNKKIIPGKKLKNQNLKLMFVSLVLEQIWAVYENCMVNRDDEKLSKITERLNIQLSARDLRLKDLRAILTIIMSQWLPLSHALLGMVIDYLPSPVKSQNEKMTKLLNESFYKLVPEGQLSSDFEHSVKNCESDESNLLAYVSKMLSIPNTELPRDAVIELTEEQKEEKSRLAREQARKASEAAAKLKEEQAAEESTNDEFALPLAKLDPFEWEYEEDFFDDDEETNETLVAFTRIFSGTLTRGQTITVVGPKYDPSLPEDSITNIPQVSQIIVQDLFLIMGRELVRMETVPAGNIVGVVGLDGTVLKTATLLSSSIPSPFINLSSTSTLIHNKPIMKIAVEPTNLLSLGKLERGLELLSHADPVFEWYIDDDTGELIMRVAGELHLERCIKDLNDRFAKDVEVTIKEPVIPFRETLDPSGTSAYNEEDDVSNEVEGLHLEFETFPLDPFITKFLINHEQDISKVRDLKARGTIYEEFKKKLINFLSQESHTDEDSFDFGVEKYGFTDVELFVDKIVSFGPKRIGPNILIEAPEVSKFKHIMSQDSPELIEYEGYITNGFQLAMNEGPLTSEPIQGVLVVIKKAYEIDNSNQEFLLGRQGRVITQTRDLIHHNFLHNGARICLAMYTCEIQATTEALGKVYAVVQKRGGHVVSEEIKEGTPFFTIVARVPVIEAYGFSEEIRKRTSGAASPQLIFDGFDILEIDPYWVPHTEEELEEFGEFAERENVARRYMNDVRRRKGLFVDEKIVSNAEKQRTMKKD